MSDVRSVHLQRVATPPKLLVVVRRTAAADQCALNTASGYLSCWSVGSHRVQAWRNSVPPFKWFFFLSQELAESGTVSLLNIEQKKEQGLPDDQSVADSSWTLKL